MDSVCLLHWQAHMPNVSLISRSMSWSLATKLFVVGSALLALALASITLTLWVTWKLDGGAAAVNVFTRIQLALFGCADWRTVPTLPVELILLPRWF